MKKFTLAFFAAASLFAFSASADQISGYISESHCGAKHDSPSAANTKCVETCLKGGSAPVLVQDGKVVTFDTDSQKKALAFAGKNVTIDGTKDGDVLKINSISAAQ